MPTLNLGRIAIVPKGNWTAGTYKKLDSVRHSGAAWLCMAAPTTTQEPSGVAVDWMKLVEDGTGTGDVSSDEENVFTALQTFSAGTRLKHVALGAGSAIDLALGDVFSKTISGATTFTLSNVATPDLVSAFILELTNGGSASVTLWSGVKWAGGTTPTLTTSGVDILGFITRDGGTTWRGFVLAKDSK